MGRSMACLCAYARFLGHREFIAIRQSPPIQAGEKVYIHVEATTQTLSKRASSSASASGGGGGRGAKRAAAREEQRKAASIRFRTEVGHARENGLCCVRMFFVCACSYLCTHWPSPLPQGGVEGRLPTDIASVLMPLLAASDGGPGATKKGYAMVDQAAELGFCRCPTFDARTGATEEGGFVRYVKLEARTVAPIYRTQLFSKVSWPFIAESLAEPVLDLVYGQAHRKQDVNIHIYITTRRCPSACACWWAGTSSTSSSPSTTTPPRPTPPPPSRGPPRMYFWTRACPLLSFFFRMASIDTDCTI